MCSIIAKIKTLFASERLDYTGVLPEFRSRAITCKRLGHDWDEPWKRWRWCKRCGGEQTIAPESDDQKAGKA